MSRIEDSSLTPLELLQFDELCDQIEAAVEPDRDRFDVSTFLNSVDSKKLKRALLKEFEHLHPNPVGATRLDDNEETLILSSHWASLKTGMVIDGFELVEMVGKGATAAVWKARDLDLDRYVALKFPTACSAEVVERLSRESKAVAKLRHPNIAAIHEIRSGYLVSEFIEGTSLKEYLQKNPVLEQDQCIDLMIRIAEAIAYSHSMGVIHRDIKPQNILIDREGVPYVVDFGLARILNSEQLVLTNEGDIIGTPGYMSPEQASGETDISESADIYSLGVLMYRLLTQKLPFGGNVQSVIYQIINEEPPSLRKRNPLIPRDLETICLKCLAKSPQARFASAQDLEFELRRFRNGESILSRPVPRIERLLRWTRRRPIEAALVGMLAICICVLLTGAIAFGVSMRRARDQEFHLRVAAVSSEKQAIQLKKQVEQALKDSLLQKEIAELRARESKSSLEFLKSVFHDSDPLMWVLKGDGIGSGKPPSLKQLFENASLRIESEFEGDDQAKAALMETLGDSCRSLGFFQLSRKLLTKARDCRSRLKDQRAIQSDPVRRTSSEFNLVKNRYLFARLSHDCGQFQHAEQEYVACIAEARNFRDEMPQSAHQLHSELMFHRGRLCLSSRRNAEAKKCFHDALDTCRAFPGKNAFLVRVCKTGIELAKLKPGEFPSTLDIEKLFSDDSWAQRVVHQFSEMFKHRVKRDFVTAGIEYRKALKTLREKLPEDHPYYLLAQGDFAGVQWRAGYYDEAKSAIESAIEHAQKIAPDHPELMNARIHIGQELSRHQQVKEGVVYLESAMKTYRKIHGTKKINGILWMELAERYIQLERFADAEKLCREIRPVVKWNTVPYAWLCHLESKAYSQSDPEKAKVAHKYAVSFARTQKRFPENGIWCERLSQIMREEGEVSLAVQYAQAAVEFDSARFTGDHPRVANRRIFLAECLRKSGNVYESKKEYAKALRIRKKFLDPENRLIHELSDLLKSLD